MINQSILEQKIQTLLQYPILNQTVVKKMGEVLPILEDWHLLRINPFDFAQQQGLSENECLDAFIHGAKIGLFDFSYSMVCPLCSGLVHNHSAIEQLKPTSFYCAVCNINVPTTLDDQVEVSFTLHSSIKTLDIDPLADLSSYHRYHFSHNYQFSEPAKSCFSRITKELIVLAPDAQSNISLTINSPQFCRLASVENNTAISISFEETKQSLEKSIHTIDLLPTGFVPSELYLPLGDFEFQVKNHTSNTIGILLYQPQKEKILEILKTYPTTIKPFLTAKILLNNQSFRELFRIDPLVKNLNLNVKNLTIMFTDLRGSTEMYDKAGDLVAYKLVKAHFQILMTVVRQFSGAIVKTMGDAIMATFSRPLDGFLAALEMLKQIEQLNQEWQTVGYQIGLKIGLNEGPALAVVNDERIDYFGQSVNIAARVQGLATSGEIWISQSILDSPGVKTRLNEQGYQTKQHSAILKGVEQPTMVHKVFK